jgi:hypothetical protein
MSQTLIFISLDSDLNPRLPEERVAVFKKEITFQLVPEMIGRLPGLSVS